MPITFCRCGAIESIGTGRPSASGQNLTGPPWRFYPSPRRGRPARSTRVRPMFENPGDKTCAASGAANQRRATVQSTAHVPDARPTSVLTQRRVEELPWGDIRDELKRCLAAWKLCIAADTFHRSYALLHVLDKSGVVQSGQVLHGSSSAKLVEFKRA